MNEPFTWILKRKDLPTVLFVIFIMAVTFILKFPNTMYQAYFFAQQHPRLCATIFCTLIAMVLAAKCLRMLASGLYQPRNQGDDDLLTIKDFDNDKARN